MSDNDYTPEIPLKKCTKCGELKPHWEFYKDKKSKDGLLRICKKCHAIKRDGQYRPGTPPGFKWCPKCKQFLLATSEYFYVNNRSKTGFSGWCKKCIYKRYLATADKSKARVKKWQDKNPERTRQYKGKWNENNRDYMRRYLTEHRESFRVNGHNYRARKRSLSNTFTVEDWHKSLEYFHGCCAVCGKPLNDLFGTHSVSLDHWIALNDPRCPGTVPINMLPLCNGVGGCNTSKKDKDPEQWLIEHFGKRKAKQILDRINAYFEWVKAQDRE